MMSLHQPEGTVRMDLFEAAKQARLRAYAPYSNFKVGAAILADNGRVYSGCNVENASYPEGSCAETSAIAAMINDGGKRIEKVLVIADTEDPITPCGGCRQRLAEFADGDTPVLLAGLRGVALETTLGALLPSGFAASHMEVS
jgi:cytidine deaminase